MKVILEFDSYEERKEIDSALNGGKYKYKLEEVWEVLFRPRHKHSYSDHRINELIAFDGPDTPESIACNKLLDLLEEKYREIIHDNE